jgi:hypothetical protein
VAGLTYRLLSTTTMIGFLADRCLPNGKGVPKQADSDSGFIEGKTGEELWQPRFIRNGKFIMVIEQRLA